MSKKILFFHNTNASWIDRDLVLLDKHFNVVDVYVKESKDFIKLSTFKSILKSDILYFWFGSLNFLPFIIFAKLLGKKIVVVSGGYDAARVPKINYGAFNANYVMVFFRRFLFKLATKIICISKVNLNDTLINARVPTSKCELILHGFDEPKIELNPLNKRRNQIVFLARSSQSTYELKGIGYLLDLAKLMPDFDFILMGQTDDFVENKVAQKQLPNLKLIGFVEFGSKQFNTILNESKFVLMLSTYESFGAALVDAAIMGCYPVCFDSYGLAEVNTAIGQTVEFGDLDTIKQTIHGTSGNYNPIEISNKMLKKYPLKLREQKITKLIENL